MLTVDEVARHYALKPDTIRRHIRRGDLDAVRLNRSYRIDWPAVWSCEEGPVPRGRATARYQVPLLTKNDLAAALRVSPRTVERWVETGLPTRNVFGRVRINPYDAARWLSGYFGEEFSAVGLMR
jgi:excisionase family DNA binding protein